MSVFFGVWALVAAGIGTLLGDLGSGPVAFTVIYLIALVAFAFFASLVFRELLRRGAPRLFWIPAALLCLIGMGPGLVTGFGARPITALLAGVGFVAAFAYAARNARVSGGAVQQAHPADA